ncbi:diguanylate cyclase [Roseibium sediminicola]|uniref:diguanylate cyclase n=1 Tax=Roseibium sediminicola TaxID=2933272 RepID=A0ABT0GVW4_9HYPH|nr:diguanylate cyclase [Roseibium sp. CAU 1639]MCK7613579.1 diguanylate cyclase [Roseibium sp. CAU 1639]
MLNSHRNWVYRLNKTLICGLDPTSEMIAEDAHVHCAFGHWLEQRAQHLDLDTETLSNLVGRHKKVHDLAREMALTVRDGHTIEESLYDEFLAISERFIGLIESAYDALIASINATDPLTGAENRSLMNVRLEERKRIAAGKSSQAWIIMIDLDHFKSVNDDYGHEVGDHVLKGFGSLVRDHIRGDDLFFRYGGEEFLLCISGVSENTVARVAERLRKACANKVYKVKNDKELSVTASFGIAGLTDYKQISDAINAADIAMYAAKRAGRNRVVFDRAGEPVS